MQHGGSIAQHPSVRPQHRLPSGIAPVGGNAEQHRRSGSPGGTAPFGGTVEQHRRTGSHIGTSPSGGNVEQHRRTGIPRIDTSPSNRSNDRPPRFEHGRIPPVSSTPRFGTEPPLRHERRPSAQSHWSSNWRHDQRYNWHDYRQRHPSVYRVGHYRDPYGWGYQSYSIGWRLWPFYYSSAYWILDPWMYRLPPAPAGTRWIRYYDDAVLVDEWTGEVLDVIHGFFW